MNAAKLQTIGIQVLTVALLALAVMAYLTAVISSPTASEAGAPMPRAVSLPNPAAAEGAMMPATPSTDDAKPNPMAVPPPSEPLPEMAPFHGKKGDYRYDPIILRAARDYGIDPAVIKAVVMAESGFEPQAISYAGAQGLMQLMPRTARALNVPDALDPEANIQGGTRYLKTLLQRFDGSLELALASYNAGSRNVHKHNGIPPFKATRRYIAKIKIYHQYYRRQGFALASHVAAATPPELDRFSPLSVARCVTVLSSWYNAAV